MTRASQRLPLPKLAGLSAAASFAIFLGLGVYGFVQDIAHSAIMRANGSTHTAFDTRVAFAGAISRSFGLEQLVLYAICMAVTVTCCHFLPRKKGVYWAVAWLSGFLTVGVLYIVPVSLTTFFQQWQWLFIPGLRSAVYATCFTVIRRPVLERLGVDEIQ